MTYEEALSKAAKLLRLKESSNSAEAALAASKAQEIIDRYNIEAIALEYASNGEAKPNEPIKDFGLDPLDKESQRIATWTWRLFLVLAKANGCRGYLSHIGGIAIVGRPSDVSTVRYFYAWLKNEVNQLANRDCKGNGRTWANNYRNGVIDTIAQRMAAQRKETIETVRHEIEIGALPEAAKSMALVRLQGALTKIERKGTETESWMKSNLRLSRGSSSYSRQDYSARQAGQKAGHEIRMKPAKAHIN